MPRREIYDGLQWGAFGPREFGRLWRCAKRGPTLNTTVQFPSPAPNAHK